MQIGFLFKLLQVKAIAFAEHFPIDVTQIVARRVLAMLGKLVREAAIGAAVKAGDVAFDNSSSAQLQALQAARAFAARAAD